MKYTNLQTRTTSDNAATSLQISDANGINMELLANVLVNYDCIPGQSSAHTNRGGVLPLYAINKKAKTRTVIAFDWVEYTGKKLDAFLCRNQEKYRLATGNAPFIQKVEMEIAGEWEPVATLWTDLKAGIDKSWCKVKLENKFCYQHGQCIIDLIKDLNSCLGIEFKNYTRLDLACDMQSTDYRNFTPQDFIDKVGKKKYIFKGGKKWKHEDGSGGITMEESAAPIAVEGRANKVEYIRIGKRSSGLAIIMYNKTKELLVKGEKGWIRDNWKEAGLKEDCDTFRIEFNYMKSKSSMVLLDKGTGEMEEYMQHADINCLLQLDVMFRTLYNKHFVVAVWEKDVRFSRMKRVNLLTFEDTFLTKMRLSDKLKATNYTKQNIKVSISTGLEYYFTDRVFSSNIFRYAEVLINKHGLQKWFAEKYPEMELEKWIINPADIYTVGQVQQMKFEQREIPYVYKEDVCNKHRTPADEYRERFLSTHRN